MHLAALAKVLGKADKVVIDGGAQNGVLPFLPLRGTEQATQPAGGGTDGQGR